MNSPSLPVSFAIRKLVNRCIAHPDLMVDPVGVLANERDKMIDEIEAPWAERVRPLEKPKAGRRAV